MSEADHRTDDPWPAYATGPKEHLHALGALALNFNLYELSLLTFFEQYMPLMKPVADYIFEQMSNEARVGLIQRLAELYEADDATKSEIRFALMHFQTCAENHRSLLHSRLQVTAQDVLGLERSARADPGRTLPFGLPLGDVRRVADEIMAGVNFVLDLWWYVGDRDKYQYEVAAHREGMAAKPPQGPPPALPGRPRVPRRIAGPDRG